MREDRFEGSPHSRVASAPVAGGFVCVTAVSMPALVGVRSDAPIACHRWRLPKRAAGTREGRRADDLRTYVNAAVASSFPSAQERNGLLAASAS